MEALTSLIYVEGNALLTVCNIVALGIGVELVGVIIAHLGRLSR